MNLERDGLLIDFYQLLWMKSDLLTPNYNNFKINIPDTIIFSQNNPLNWYFTSKEGLLCRKKKTQITIHNIYQTFTRKCSKSSIIGYYLSEKITREQEQNNIFQKIKDKNVMNSHERYSHNNVYFEYITKDNFWQFLTETQKEKGILQFFVEPYGQYNSMIEVNWGPNICLFSKKANVNKYADKLDVYEKLATFEGPEFLSRVIPFSSVNQTQYLRNMVVEMVKKIQMISSNLFKIRRLIVFFKIDKNSVPNFLFCTASRIEKNIKIQKVQNLNYYPLEIQNNLKYPKNVKAIYTINKSSPKKLIQSIKCVLCEQPQVQEDLISINYQFIVEVNKKLDINVLKALEETQQNKNLDHDPDENILYFQKLHQKNLDNITRQMEDERKLKKQKKNQQEKTDLTIQKNIQQMVQESYIQYKYKKSSMNNLKIPFLFRKLHPYMSYEDYQQLEKQKNFMMKQTQLCLKCYLECTQQQLTAGSYPITKQDQKSKIQKQLEENPEYQDQHQKNLIKEKKVVIEQKEYCCDYLNENVAKQRLLQETIREASRKGSKTKESGNLNNSHLQSMSTRQDQKSYLNRKHQRVQSANIKKQLVSVKSVLEFKHQRQTSAYLGQQNQNDKSFQSSCVMNSMKNEIVNSMKNEIMNSMKNRNGVNNLKGIRNREKLVLQIQQNQQTVSNLERQYSAKKMIRQQSARIV